MPVPDIKTPLPGPKAKAHHRARRLGRLAVLHALLSVRDGPRLGRDRRGRRRQRVPRLRRRHCRQLDRPLASRCRRGDRRSGAEVPAHVGHRLLLRAAGASRRGDERHRAVGGAEAVVLLQFGHRGDRSGDQAGALSHEAPRHHRVPRQLPRPHAGIAVADVEQGDSAARGLGRRWAAPITRRIRIRTAARPGESADACAAATLDYIEDQILVHLVSPDEVAAVARRADPGRRRLRRAAGGVPPAAARADDASTACC